MKGYTLKTYGFGANFTTAILVGLIGGFFLGVWDCVTAILVHAPRPFPFLAMLSFSLSPIALYLLSGCAVMAVCSAVVSLLMRIGRYVVNREILTGLYAGIFTVLTVSMTSTSRIGIEAIEHNLIPMIIEISLLSILCGLAAGGLSVYILNTIPKIKLLSLSISLSVSFLIFLYSELWISINWLPEFWKPVSLMSGLGLFVLSGFLAMGLYILSVSMLQRNRPGAGRERTGALILLAVVVFVFLVISVIARLKNDHVPKEGDDHTLKTNAKSVDVELKDRPNILWIVLDTVRADHLSGYGYSRKTTPNIDRIASQGALFENVISAAPWTLPSHASMFTGMYPSRHRANGEHFFLSDDFQTITEILRRHGYKTFGYSNNPFVSGKTNLNQGFDIFEFSDWGQRHDLNSFLMMNAVARNIKSLIGMQDKGARETNKIVMEWIRNGHDSLPPFFIFINYIDAHLPYKPCGPYDTIYLDRKIASAKVKKTNQDPHAYLAKKVAMNDDDFEILRSLYDGEISYLDFNVNQLFDLLSRLRILDKTLLIITSDHGENIGDHGLMDHVFCLYDTLLHVPLIIRYPKVFKPRSRIQEQVQTTDIVPTILNILGIDWNEAGKIDGHSLVPSVGKAQQQDSEFSISEDTYFPLILSILNGKNYEFDASIYTRRLRSVRTKQFKYIWASDGRDELYNLQIDPGEENNLIKSQPGKAKELKTILMGYSDSSEKTEDQAK